jgi:RNase adapter protein RapZ
MTPSVVVVVTGLSGAGKTTALNALADAGYYCVDNLPPQLASDTVNVCARGGIDRVALGMDVRVGAFLDGVAGALAALQQAGREPTVLYLDAGDDVLVRRFSETRRPHPVLAGAGAEHAGGQEREPLPLYDAVRLEREHLAVIRDLATQVIDTTHLSVHELRRQIIARFSPEPVASSMEIKVLSFGYKHGLPLDADLVFDVRFLDNPHFVPHLREHDGEHREVRSFVLASPGASQLLDHLEGLLAFTIPRYRREGKSYLTVAIGCTGGRHRSVCIAAALADRLASVTGERVGIVHRDVERGGILSGVSGTRDEREARWSQPGDSREGVDGDAGGEDPA